MAKTNLLEQQGLMKILVLNPPSKKRPTSKEVDLMITSYGAVARRHYCGKEKPEKCYFKNTNDYV
jgi:hypothetical protein